MYLEVCLSCNLNVKAAYSDKNFELRLTCIYTACKAEENHVSAEELGKGIEQSHQMILNNEMIVLQAWIYCTKITIIPYILNVFKLCSEHLYFYIAEFRI